MQTIDKYIKLPKDTTIDLKNNLLIALKNPKFETYISQLNIPDDLAMKYTSRLEEASEEFYNCQNCKAIETCQNKIKGYLYTPVKDNRLLTFSYIACPYEIKRLKNNAYQKYLYLYNIPTEMKYASFKNIYKDDKKRIPIIKYFTEFIADYLNDKEPKGVYLHGSFGSGKTYLIAALFNELAKKNVDSAMVYFPEFLRHLKSSFNDDFEEKFNTIRTVALLLLDDIGSENVTAWGRDEILGPILQYRMEHNLPTFFTSNLTLEELEHHLGNTKNTVDQLKGRRIIERIKQLSLDFELISENRRK